MAAAGALFWLSSPLPGRAASFAPPDGEVLLVVGQNRQTCDDYVKAVGKVPGGFMFYTSIGALEGLQTPYQGAGYVQDAQHLVDTYPNTTLQIGFWMVDCLPATIAGKYDANLDRLAAWAKKAKRPIYLRIGYEFDGAHNHYDPKDYVEAFRHIVKRLRDQKADNIAFVWHSVAGITEKPPETWYPGDEYVDWFAVSYFDQSARHMDPMTQLAAQHGKPLMVAECTPKGQFTRHGLGVWNLWFKNFFHWTDKAGVKAISYIDDNWDDMEIWKGQHWGDARVEANQAIKAKWIEQVGQPKFLQSSPELFKKLGYSAD